MRVVRIGVWEMPTDAEARRVFESHLRDVVSIAARN